MIGRKLLGTFRRELANSRRLWRFPQDTVAAGRVAWGTVRLTSRARRPAPTHRLDVLTFSVIPGLTRLWSRLCRPAFDSTGARVIIGDCSGRLRASAADRSRVVPIYNLHHGRKIDLFLAKECRAELVLVCDDDVFPSSSEVGDALAAVSSSNELVACSLAPREHVSSLLQGRLSAPMGSSCVLIDRQLWLSSGLSFEAHPPLPGDPTDWMYDTGDLAHVRALELGLAVRSDPAWPSQRGPRLEAMSAWLLRFRDPREDTLEKSVAGIPIRQRKALRVLLVAEHFRDRHRYGLIEARYLEHARAVLERHPVRTEEGSLRQELAATLLRLDEMMAASSHSTSAQNEGAV